MPWVPTTHPSDWGRSSASHDQLVKQLEGWLRQAETSGVIALQQFSRKLYRFG